MTHRTPLKNKFLHVLLSNSFPRLRICTMFDIGVVTCSDTWMGSSTLQTLNLPMKNPLDQGKLRSLCPRLRRLTTDEFPIDGFSAGNALTFWQHSIAISWERLSVELQNLVHRYMFQSSLTSISFISIDFSIHVLYEKYMSVTQSHKKPSFFEDVRKVEFPANS